MSLLISVCIVLGIVILVGTVIFLLDVVPLLRQWLSRIYIGRQQDTLAWSRLIRRKGLTWLHHTPVMKITDQTRITVLDRLKGQYSNPTLQEWQHAALLLGLAEGEPDDAERTGIHRFLSSCFHSDGSWRTKPVHVDSAIVAYSLFRTSSIEITSYRPALDDMYDLIQDHIGSDGTVQYRKRMADYRYVDTIGFICPFLISYGLTFNKPNAIDLAIKQISAYIQYGMQANKWIPCHAYDVRTFDPLGIYGWGRGMGWFAIGLIDSWELLPQNHTYKLKLQQYVVDYARSIMACQQPSGNWNWTVTRRESRPDSSATAMLCWFLIKAAAIPELFVSCGASVSKGITYLKSVTRRDGAIEFSQGDTKDIGHYSTLFGIMPFTQGFAIRLSKFVKDEGLKEIIYEDNSVYANV
jgi:unsaturated rhamnogalacturonyl hydrolase